MVAPVTVKVEKGKGGKVIISEGEYTSEGFCTEGLNPLNKSAAGWACYLVNPKGVKHDYPNNTFSGSYVKATRADFANFDFSHSLNAGYCPVINNTSGSIVGYKYFNFDNTAKLPSLRLVAHLKPEGIDGKIAVLIGSPKESKGGKKIGEFAISKNAPQQIAEYDIPISSLQGVKGKQPLFFVFSSDTEDRSICELYDFQFVKR